MGEQEGSRDGGHRREGRRVGDGGTQEGSRDGGHRRVVGMGEHRRT